MEARLKVLKESIESYPDFPKPGVNFKDIFSVMRHPEGYAAMLELVKEKARWNYIFDILLNFLIFTFYDKKYF